VSEAVFVNREGHGVHCVFLDGRELRLTIYQWNRMLDEVSAEVCAEFGFEPDTLRPK